MNPLVIIPARGGSKGVPGKNIKLLGGKPLIQYTIEAAQKVFDNNIICVSTDDESIKKCAEEKGLTVPFLRPGHLASDTATTQDVLLHAVEYYSMQGYVVDTVVLLQPTSPFRNSQHIKAALQLYDNSLDMVVSVKETKSNPYYVLFEEDQYGFLKKSKDATFTRRQDCPKIWEFNGAIYIINVNSLLQKSMSSFTKNVKYVMDEESSHDIDTLYDWKIAEFMLGLSV